MGCQPSKLTVSESTVGSSVSKAIQPRQRCQFDHDATPMSFVPKQPIATVGKEKSLNQLPPDYMYSSIFKDIILDINEGDEKSMQALVTHYEGKDIPNSELQYFQSQYRQHTAVWWYTCAIFLYERLNRAIRDFNTEVMIKMGFFIRRLHQELEQLHKKQSANDKKVLIVYRGQGLSPEGFQRLLNTKGGLLSFNSFLSTSIDKDVAMRFLTVNLGQYENNVGAFFIMTIDPTKALTSKTPFAFIEEYTAIKGEQEILFSMHTVFRVDDIKQSTKNQRIWEVQLTLTDDNDPQLAGLIDYIKKDISGTGWDRMAYLMLKVGHFNQAVILYNELLKNATHDSTRAHIYTQLASARKDRGEYIEAAILLEKALEIKQKTLKENDPSLAPAYNNIALLYNYMGDYSKALQLYERALTISEIALPSNDPNLGICYCNLGDVYNNMGDYSKALEFHEKAHQIREKALPSNHPDLATSFNNIGLAYKNMDNYEKALEFYEKSLKIYEIALPPNHPWLATSYSNIGDVYNNMSSYSKALEFHVKAHQIREKVLPSNHPDLATSYNNIGMAYAGKGDYPEAVSFLEKALAIYKRALPPNHPDITMTVNNIAAVKEKM